MKKRLEENKKLHDAAMENLTDLVKEKDKTISELKSMMARAESKSIQNDYQLQASLEKIQNYEVCLMLDNRLFKMVVFRNFLKFRNREQQKAQKR